MYGDLFQKRLRVARKAIGFTQRDVADELKISHQNISHYETGITEPDLETLTQLADFYGVSIDWLLGNIKSLDKDTVSKWDGLKRRADNFPNNLRAARLKKGLTQVQVSNLLSISRSNIAKYELGQLQPSIKTLTKLILFYQVEADRLLGLAE